MRPSILVPVAGICAVAALVACGGGDDDKGLPQLGEAQPGTLADCAGLATRLSFSDTTFTSVEEVSAGTLTVAGTPVGAHCRVVGTMEQRVSDVDGNSYAIGFEMRMPLAWNGRFFYQANGGIDGNVVPATGAVNGGGGLDNALNMGFAVISSDAGHAGSMGPFFGIDPQARLNYGYQAVAKLTPMAKAVIKVAYGRNPDRSYIGGCSNGGRHTMVTAARIADQYDGYLVGDPGFNLPKAAIANIAGAQTYATLATNPADLGTGFTVAERTLVSNAVLAKCDALDGATDGLVQDTTACQAAFSLDRDVPTCSGERDGTCLSAAQKTGIAKLFAGATTSTGATIYNSFPYDNGLATNGWSFWKFTAPLILDSGAVGLIWQVPPEDPATFSGPTFALTGNVDTMLAKVNATDATYTESGLSFMTPPNPSDLGKLKNRGAKMMIYHGTADPIFSSDDTTTFYENLRTANSGDASNFARFYRVPGMNHCAGGPATDQFDMLKPLVAWVERGEAPDQVLANVRGTGNPGGANADVPATWSPLRSRPLCAYPKVARYLGNGSQELAENFSCQ
ncbi:tannase/feruloyl esterase family alpha/beta hydrolase [Ideonella sp. YS5]|uniref:tannase/feruloyl esterase family alpha/beta hydrolase n=1 Tax=Ideonella sp. YS5 TaxID=3453714 RepID=UPI003EEFD9E8